MKNLIEWLNSYIDGANLLPEDEEMMCQIHDELVELNGGSDE